MAQPSSSNSEKSFSEYFEDDPEFLEALSNVVLPGDITPPHKKTSTKIESTSDAGVSLKRSRSSSFDVPLAASSTDGERPSYTDSHTYGASRFGEFGEYMSRKRAKLQIQNTEMGDPANASAVKSNIFRGIAIYINGWTDPSVQDLRQLILEHGGTFQAYLDKKGLVTHIITCSLTPAKIREFQHMKVVRPTWLVESARSGTLLPWQDFMFLPGDRAEDAQGKISAQTSLLGFASQKKDGITSRPGNVKHSKAVFQQGDNSLAPITLSHKSEPSLPSQADGTNSPSPSSSNSSPSRPIYTTDPVTAAETARVPGYAAHKSNPNAQRVMANSEWRSAHTSVASDFIKGYYENSRLHHLSTWKSELKNLVTEAQERAETANANGPSSMVDALDSISQEMDVVLRSAGLGVSMRGAELVMKSPSKGKGKGKEQEKADTVDEKVIMHCDFDSFFVSAGLVDRPHMRGKPVVVCHSQGAQGGGSSTSEIASASYEARKFGIKGGMSLQQARKLCPTVMTIPYEFERYKQFSLQFYTILMSYADDLQAVSVDEALIEVTSRVAQRRVQAQHTEGADPFITSAPDHAKNLAEEIRAKVKKATDCEVSVGISHNIMLARLATRRAKPAGSYHLLLSDLNDFLAPLHLDDLPGFGRATRDKAEEKLGSSNLGDLTQKSRAVLCDALGKGTGETLYKALRGIDERKLESDKPRKSVSCEINYGIRFETNDQVEVFIYQMAEEVARRLDTIDMRGRSLTLKVMTRAKDAPIEPPKFLGHGHCDTFNKQTALSGPGGKATSDPKVIGETSWRLMKSFDFDPKELRGLGVQIQKLEGLVATSVTESGQPKLPFKRVDGGAKGPSDVSSSNLPDKSFTKPLVIVHPPSQDADASVPHVASTVDLPSFSQVDMSVFEALPEDVRKELEAEYKRRSASPALVQSTSLVSKDVLSVPPDIPRRKITVKGTNPKRITRQLAPRSRSSISPTKSKLFVKREAGPSTVRVTEEELQRLDIDPEVFAALPIRVQREQLAVARHIKAGGVIEVGERKIIKPPSRRARAYYRRPPPKAIRPPLPSLKQQSADGVKIFFTEAEDVQDVIEKWVEGFREHRPNGKDVEYFAKFLAECVDGEKATDVGIERAVMVMKWWQVLLRRYWGVWEDGEKVCEVEPVEETRSRVTSEMIGRAWWEAFKDVKGRIDLLMRKRFGGCLSLK